MADARRARVNEAPARQLGGVRLRRAHLHGGDRARARQRRAMCTVDKVRARARALERVGARVQRQGCAKVDARLGCRDVMKFETSMRVL
jgi:hypothetical protein